MPENLILKSQSRIASLMGKLKTHPPNCLLLEGGSCPEREFLALYWAMSLNCKSGSGPCFECRPCVQISNESFRDLYFLGSGDKIKIDQIRELRTIYPQKPHFFWRLVVISEAQTLRVESANALLKSLEEPAPGNSFVLLAPQRESVFSTLVSRSIVMTLSRQADISFNEDLEETFREIKAFVRTGKGWLNAATGKIKPNIVQARHIVSRCRHELILSMLKNDSGNLFHRFSPESRYHVQNILTKAEHCLTINYIRVDMVVEWLAVSLWKNYNQREKDVYRTRHLSV